MAKDDFDGAWFQYSSVAGAAATSGGGCGLLQAPTRGVSNVATGGAAVVAPGGAARDEANATAGHGPSAAMCCGCCG
eukprot:2242292-Prymnesium_polylepis.1